MPEVSRTRATLRSAEFGFFGRGRVDARADAPTLRAALEGRRLGLLDLVLAALADQLLDGGHAPRLRLVLRCRAVLCGVSRCSAVGCRPGPTAGAVRPTRSGVSPWPDLAAAVRGRHPGRGQCCSAARAGRSSSTVRFRRNRGRRRRTREGPGIAQARRAKRLPSASAHRSKALPPDGSRRRAAALDRPGPSAPARRCSLDAGDRASARRCRQRPARTLASATGPVVAGRGADGTARPAPRPERGWP